MNIPELLLFTHPLRRNSGNTFKALTPVELSPVVLKRMELGYRIGRYDKSSPAGLSDFARPPSPQLRAQALHFRLQLFGQPVAHDVDRGWVYTQLPGHAQHRPILPTIEIEDLKLFGGH